MDGAELVRIVSVIVCSFYSVLGKFLVLYVYEKIVESFRIIRIGRGFMGKNYNI